ncbi:MAG: HEAT repeat domain-containing protein [Gemmatimonadaceae bacterium]
MTRFVALLIVATLQFAFIVLTLVLLFATRFRGSRFRTHADNAVLTLAGPLRKIMLGDDRGEALAAALSRLRPDVATRALIVIAGARLSAEQRRGLAALVREAPWVERSLAQVASRKWWKRMEAARLMVMVCDQRDGELVARLVTDPHPAVASAATKGIGGCASVDLIRTVVAGLPARSPTVRLQQCNSLRNHASLAAAAVTELLSAPASAQELRAWIQLVEVLAEPKALAAVVPLALHPDVEVRASAARALRSYFSPDAVEAVTRLLGDSDWRVRAAAARAVGALNVVNAIPLLTDSMHDESWWVRFRAGLALADLSQEGRAALAAAQLSPDPFARDMATLIRGLSDGSRIDLTSA